MTEVLILTAAQADKVRGLSPTKEGHALIPVECEDGSFKLGPEVLTARAFAHVREMLSALPRSKDIPAKERAAEDITALRMWSAEQVSSADVVGVEVVGAEVRK